ncbi:uncharacterized protein FPOAC1_012943 [Fusarium poae]|uniref:uncharacterized protein n=2 Tax=Fusarium poae TaxID=36050 RepID=UPI001D0504E9|nr:uncharacterized protein FPOAC1_012943 [Fusarium poae]KAG8664966.1 hypothetical protein FPOAC1_012943 [Fusarium poae]
MDETFTIDQFHELCHKGLPLKLAIIQCRLARWGARAHGEKPFEEYLEDKELKMMQEILQGMVRSRRDLAAIDEDQQRDDENMPIVTTTKRVRDKLQKITEKRLHGADLIKKTSWKIYEKGRASILIGRELGHI